MAEGRNPFGLHTVTPYLIVQGAATLMRFLREVFNAQERGSTQYREDGSVKHAEMRLGDSILMIGEPTGDIGPMPATMYVYVNDCDATYKKALEVGGSSILAPENYPHGDRYGGVRDPVGNIWWVVTHVGKADA